MALNNRSFARIATRFQRVLLKLSAFPGGQTGWPNSPMLVIQAPPGQTVDLVQIQDPTGAVLYSIGANGRPVLNAPQRPLTLGVANALADIAVPASAMVGGCIHYVVGITDNTEFQSLAGIVTYSAVNKAGTVTGTITEVAANQAKTVTGASTLTLAWTVTAGAGKITLKVQPTTSLTAMSLNLAYTLTPIVGAATAL
jgi:hypothetical protein